MNDKNHMRASSAMVGTFDLFRNLKPNELASIADLMHVRRYHVGSYIINSAVPGTDVYFLISGKVRVCAYSVNGKQVLFEDLAAGSLFGELSAIDQGERSGDCIALGAVTIAVMTSDEFISVAHQYPSVFNALLCRLSGMVRRQMNRVYEFTSCTVSQRVRFELLRIAAEAEAKSSRIADFVYLQSPPTHAEIATRISSHREAVTRELKKLEAMGVIQWRPGAHVIHDMNALVELAAGE